jgi:hypothetical protein
MRTGALILVAVLLALAPQAEARDKPVLIRVQAQVFQLQSPLPVAVTIRILGPAPGFPQVVTVPAAPGSVAVPYPDTRMRVQVRIAPGVWSHVVTLTRRPTIQRLPILF